MNQAVAPAEPELLRRALKEIRALKEKVGALEAARPAPVAVVGMACRFPGADHPAAFWELLAAGRDAVREVPPDRWDVDAYFDPDPEAPGKMYSRWGGFLDEIDRFSPGFFGISPREAAAMDPQQRLLLEVAWQALENAGLPPDRLAGRRVGVFVGVGATDYVEREAARGPEAIGAYNGTGNSLSVAAGRLSYSLGLRGPSVSLDTACSSSLAALHLALRSLREGESEVALVGGVSLVMSPESLITLCKARMLSPDGRCKTFDAAANGYVRGEGCGVLVLRRLPDAMADGDAVLGLVRGSALNHNGRSAGLTVPSGPAQQELLRQALADAGLTPAEVGYVEAHGTGTAVGDPIEVEALAAVHAGRPRPLLVGSVKSNVGHLEWAAGICGVIKVLLAMQHGEIPPSLHVRRLNPLLDWARLPLGVVTAPTPWPEGPRIAGVSSFGFGGTNAHVLLEAPPPAAPRPPSPESDRPEHLLVLSARTPEALAELGRRFAALPPETSLADLCHSAAVGRSHFEHRLAVVAGSPAELPAALADARPARAAGPPRIAMLFTGQGAQRPGMGRQLFETQPVFRRTLEQCDALLRPHLELRLLDQVIYPADPDAADQPIHQTAFTQPALFALEYALAELWASWGILPDAMLGHSVGEYVAACRAGVFSLEDGLALVAARGRLMQSLPRDGAMLAVQGSAGQVAALVEANPAELAVAAVNAPGELVLAGRAAAVAAAAAALAAAGVRTRRLAVSHAFHSPLMEPILAAFAAVVSAVRLAPPRLPLVSNLTGTEASAELADPAYWVRHLREPVRFHAGIERLAGCDVFLEAGPQPVLLGLGRQCLPDAEALWLPSLSARRGDWRQMLESLGALYRRGARIDWRGFDAPYRRQRIALPGYPLERQPYPLPARTPAPSAAAAGAGAAPLVDAVLRSPLVAETVISAAIGVARYPFLADHRIFGRIILPAAGYVAMLLNGAALLDLAPCRLEELLFVAPLALAEDDAPTVQAVVRRDGSLEIVSFAPGAVAEEVTRHVTGRLAAATGHAAATAGDAPALAALRARCTEPLDPQWLADGVDGIAFGPSFRWIEAIWARGDGETLARLRRPAAAGDLDCWRLHPGLLDACFQAAEAVLGDDGEPPLPFGVRRLTTAGAGPGEVWWSHARRVGPLAWDIRLYDEKGTVVAAIDGFEARPAPRGGFRSSAGWLYRIDWQPQPLAAGDRPAGRGEWLIVDGGGGLGAGLAARLQARGQPAALLPPAPALRALEAAGALRRGVVLLCHPAPDEDPAAAAEATALGAIELAQAMARGGAAARLWCVTVGAAAAEGAAAGGVAALAQAPLRGLVRSLALEHPEWRPTLVGLPAGPEDPDLDALAAELLADGAETEVALRAGGRQVARLVRHRDTRLARPAGPFRLQLPEYGSPERLRLVPLERRPPGPGEVEVEIRAAALNFRDVLIALGMLKEHYARAKGIERAEDIRLGFDHAGVIVAVGEGVAGFRVGDAVMASAIGSTASFLTLPATDVVAKPASLGFAAASALPTVFLTAHYGLLQLAGLKAGERVLIHAASGGVGQAALQIARAAGAEILATASPEKWPALRQQGVARPFNSRTLAFRDEILELTGGEGVDVVLNSLSGEARLHSFDLLRPGGRFVEIGKLGILTAAEARARRPDAAYFVFDIDEEIDRNPALVHATLGEVRDRIDAGRLSPPPIAAFDIEEAVAAYRHLQHTRHVGKVVLDLAPRPAPVGADGAYLVSGGLGGLGLATARWLVEQGARHLLLVGRRAPSAAAAAAVAAMEAAGATVTVAQADVADEAALAALVAACPLPLRGVIHAAGLLEDATLENQTAAGLARVMRPKAAGGWALHRATRSAPLDFFVCFSSMAATMGAAGQVNYAAANSVLDALAQHRRALGLPGLSIAWGPWASVGMAAGLSLAGQGVEKIAVEDGLAVLGELLAAGRAAPAEVGVWRASWPALRRRLPHDRVPPYLGQLLRAAEGGGRAAGPAGDGLAARLRAAAAAERPALLQSAVRAALAEVLALDPGQEIPATQPWTELGVDSLMMVELKNRLEAATQLALPAGQLAREMTVAAVAAFLAERLERPAEDDPAATTAGDAGAGDAEAALHRLVHQIPQAFVTAEGQQGRRILADGRWRIDLASCNYLGLDLHPEVRAAVAPALEAWGTHPSWTRAVASPRLYGELEAALAAFVGAPGTLVFPSISLLHLGVLPALAGPDGIILKDIEAHHSMHEGCLRARADGAEWLDFPHGDVAALEARLARLPAGRTKIIATDGIFSMGASNPPLRDYARLAREHGATLYVDDAHGLGVIGERPDDDLPYGHGGNGLVRHLGLDYAEDRIVYVAGLSKAFSSYAAFVTCLDAEMRYRLEAAGPYVFSGPTCTASLASALAGLTVNAREGDVARRRIWQLARRFVDAVRAIGFEVDNAGYFPVAGVVIGGVEQLVAACRLLWEHDILITPALYPAVPLQRSLVRFSITAANSEAEIDQAIAALRAVWDLLHPAGPPAGRG
jgi:myxalamid-type polyketide synthase MxaB